MSKANPFQQFEYKPLKGSASGSPSAQNVDSTPPRRSSRMLAGKVGESSAEQSGKKRTKGQLAAEAALSPEANADESEEVVKRAKEEKNAVVEEYSEKVSAAQLQPDVQERCRALLEIAEELVRELQPLKFKSPVTHVYNPLEYAMTSYEQYVTRYGGRLGTVLLVGLNPGPWGMAQTGVPFGDSTMVKGFLGITASVDQPPKVHPKRLVYGSSCPYKEVSGQRIWGWARDRFKDPEVFFDRFYVMNYCPLAFMEGPNGKLRTPDKLPATERDAVVRVCDKALRRTIETIKPKLVVGIGQYTAERVRKCAGNVRTGTVMHPSPANPATNAGWAGIAERQLREMGVDLD